MTTKEIDPLRKAKDELVGMLTDTLSKNAFSSKYMMHPRLFPEIASDIADLFFDYLSEGNDGPVVSLGERFAELGLAGRAVVEFASALHRFLTRQLKASLPERVEELQEPVESYIAALVEGFVEGREEHVMREQERTRRALEAAQQAARHTVALKGRAIDSSAASVALTDAATTVLYANAAMANLLGYAAPAELEGRKLLDVIDPDGLGEAIKSVKRGAQWSGSVSMNPAQSKGEALVMALSPVDGDGTGEAATVLIVGIRGGS